MKLEYSLTFWGQIKPLPEPDILADEIIENIEAALVNFRSVSGQL
ncbi:hypothetical protein [Avibacterium paragallinarum]